MRTFILHWLDNSTEEAKGSDIADAFQKNGYGSEAIKALDWYEEIKEIEKTSK